MQRIKLEDKLCNCSCLVNPKQSATGLYIYWEPDRQVSAFTSEAALKDICACCSW